ncbi:SDR family oxidoreductase [Sorangium sp. So ce1504]|uniref:SDR family oxidoreductase n=1 Tax=Sorangium sp. So ce1504 TaxID=3133337 RepID=UPI003F5F153F
MNGKVCVVTGGNTGIGKETARGFAQRGAKVVLACRDTGRGEAARDDIARSTGRKDVEVIALDLGSKASIRAFGERFRAAHERLDVLVNNAGVWRSSRGTTEDGLEATFGVNHVGTWLLTQDLLPLLKKSAPSRVVVLSSKLHYRGRMDWEDLQFERRKYGTTAAYAQSKLANVLFTKALARRLEGTGVTVNAVHPGVVRTDLMRDYPKLLMKLFNLFLLTPEQGAECSLHVATAPELAGVTGEYFEKSRIKPAAEAALDEAAQERLWKLTEALAV